jgi:hypothetical protein
MPFSNSISGSLGLSSGSMPSAASGAWEGATADDVRAVLEYLGLSSAAAGRLLDVNTRTVRRWTLGESPITYAPWRLLLLYAGVVEVDASADAAAPGR